MNIAAQVRRLPTRNMQELTWIETMELYENVLISTQNPASIDGKPVMMRRDGSLLDFGEIDYIYLIAGDIDRRKAWDYWREDRPVAVSDCDQITALLEPLGIVVKVRELAVFPPHA
jgi:hypothetical protein